MPRTGKSAHKSGFRMAAGGSKAGKSRRLRSALRKREQQSTRAFGATRRALDALRSEYRKRLAKLLGRAGLRQLDEIRSRAKLSRAQRERRALAVLSTSGVNCCELLDLRGPYLKKARDLLGQFATVADPRPPHADPCGGPVAVYVPPYDGWSWSYFWERSSGPQDPVLDRYLDSATGRVGSRIRTAVTEAGDDDHLYAEYDTGVDVWHTPQRNGPLEVQLTFEFADALIEGKATDDWFWSELTHAQFVQARVVATHLADPSFVDDALHLIDTVSEYEDDGDDTWIKQIAGPFETRSYRFRTAVGFVQGSTVQLHAGVRQATSFHTNDFSVVTNTNIDLKLTRIEVRSCEEGIIL